VFLFSAARSLGQDRRAVDDLRAGAHRTSGEALAKATSPLDTKSLKSDFSIPPSFEQGIEKSSDPAEVESK
jgi:hypothetical protein